MNKKYINHIQLTDTIGLTERNDGYWLYDKIQGMNLVMRAKTPQDAFIQTIEYYQNRFNDIDQSYRDLKSRVDTFVEQFTKGDSEND